MDIPGCPRHAYVFRLSQDKHGHPRLSQTCSCVPPVPGQPWTSHVVQGVLRTNMDILCCPRHAYVFRLSQDKNGHPRLSLACSCVPPVPAQPWTSQVVPGMLHGHHQVPGPRCPICPRTTVDIPGCPWHGVWHHQVPGPSCPICPRTTGGIPSCP